MDHDLQTNKFFKTRIIHERVNQNINDSRTIRPKHGSFASKQNFQISEQVSTKIRIIRERMNFIRIWIIRERGDRNKNHA